MFLRKKDDEERQKIMYLVTSHFPLAHAKKRVETKEQVKEFIGEIIDATNSWRRSLDIKFHRLQQLVTPHEAQDAIRVLKIDAKLINEKMLGEEIPITCEHKSPLLNKNQELLEKKAKEFRRS